MEKITIEDLVRNETFKIIGEAKANHSSGTRSISPPRKLPLALSLAPLEIKVFQETLAARLPRRPSERLTFASVVACYILYLGGVEGGSVIIRVNQWLIFWWKGAYLNFG